MQIKKAEFSSRCSIKKWSKLTTFINELDSRQQEGPLLEEYINFSRCEPLPLKNNTKRIIRENLAKCIGWMIHKYMICLFSLLSNVKSNMNCNFFGNEFIAWLNDCKTTKEEPKYGFHFWEKSLNYIKNFQNLTKVPANKVRMGVV